MKLAVLALFATLTTLSAQEHISDLERLELVIQQQRQEAITKAAEKRAIEEKNRLLFDRFDKFAKLANEYISELQSGVRPSLKKKEAIHKAFEKLEDSEGW
jgi:hypothetical protein